MSAAGSAATDLPERTQAERSTSSLKRRKTANQKDEGMGGDQVVHIHTGPRLSEVGENHGLLTATPAPLALVPDSQPPQIRVPNKRARYERGVGLAVVFMAVIIDMLGLSIILPILPFLVVMYGGSSNMLGLIFAAYAITQMVSVPIAGRLSDRFGRKNLLLLSLTGSFGGFLFQGFAPTLKIFIIARALGGLFGGSIPIAQAYVADITTKKDRAKYLAMLASVQTLAFMMGPGLGAGLSEFGIKVPMFASAGLSCCALILTFFGFKEPPRPDRPLAGAAVAPSLAPSVPQHTKLGTSGSVGGVKGGVERGGGSGSGRGRGDEKASVELPILKQGEGEREGERDKEGGGEGQQGDEKEQGDAEDGADRDVEKELHASKSPQNGSKSPHGGGLASPNATLHSQPAALSHPQALTTDQQRVLDVSTAPATNEAEVNGAEKSGAEKSGAEVEGGEKGVEVDGGQNGTADKGVDGGQVDGAKGKAAEERDIDGLEKKAYKKILLLIYLSSFLNMTANSSFITMFGYFLHDKYLIGTLQLGFITTGTYLVCIIVQILLFNKMQSRFGKHWTAIMGSGVMAAFLAAIPGPKSSRTGFAVTLVIIIFYSLGFALAAPGIPAILSRYADPAVQGRVMGIGMGCQALARVVGPLVYGALYPISKDLPFYLGGALALLNSLILWLALWLNKQLPEHRVTVVPVKQMPQPLPDAALLGKVLLAVLRDKGYHINNPHYVRGLLEEFIPFDHQLELDGYEDDERGRVGYGGDDLVFHDPNQTRHSNAQWEGGTGLDALLNLPAGSAPFETSDHHSYPRPPAWAREYHEHGLRDHPDHGHRGHQRRYSEPQQHYLHSV